MQMHPASLSIISTCRASPAPLTSHAAVFGSLGNFDTGNDTGKPAYGFVIDIEDSSFDHNKVSSGFGYDRVFLFYSPEPGAVVRFGKPTITDVPGYGVRIVYGGALGSVATPANDARFKPARHANSTPTPRWGRSRHHCTGSLLRLSQAFAQIDALTALAAR